MSYSNFKELRNIDASYLIDNHVGTSGWFDSSHAGEFREIPQFTRLWLEGSSQKLLFGEFATKLALWLISLATK